MNKIFLDRYYRLYTRFVSRSAGHFIWKKILVGNGIKNINILSEEKKDDILANIYNNLFTESQKDKKITLKGIGKTYENGFKAVHNFNLEVLPKEFVCLLGPSGCGKTTALRMVAGLETITEGKYIAGSSEMNSVHPSERNTAMVFQNYALYPFMTVYDNIAFGLKLKTLKNPVYENTLKDFYNHYLPHHETIKDLKFKIYDLSHEGKAEIIEKQIIRKKLIKEGKNSQAQTINEEIKALQVNYKASKTKNADEILKTKDEIKKLTAEQKEEYKVITEKEKESIKHSKDEIKRLQEEQTDYKAKKISEIPKIKSDIANVKTEQKELQKALSAKMKEVYKLAKDKENLPLLNKGKEEMADLENKIEQKGLENLQNIEKIAVINKCNRFKINELKGKTSPKKRIKKELVESCVIWKHTIPTRVRQLSSLVGIRDYLKRKPSALSGGQRQRVALIRAISKNSQLFLFDEPLSNLDAKLRSTMRSEIRKIHKSVGATSLYVTHDQIEAMTMADKVVVINLGYIQQVGAPRDLYENPSNIFVARFIGVPTINMMEVTLDKAKSSYTVAGKEMKYKLSPAKTKLINASNVKQVILGIRPNDVVLSKPTKTGLVGKVFEKELIGSEYVVDLELPSGKIVKALSSVHDDVEIGEKFNITFAPNKVSFFNKTSGDAISSIVNKETAAALKVWKDSAEERIKNLIILDKDRNAKSLGKKLASKVKESTNQDYKKSQLHKKIDKLQEEKTDYKVFDEDEINS